MIRNRVLSMALAAAAAAACCLRLPGAQAQKPESLPDLDVLYIERTPRYPGYALSYDLPGRKGVPVLLDNRTRKPLTAAQARAVKRWPAAGEWVTFTAHVQNRGAAPAPSWEYVWYVDGRLAGAGRSEGTQPPGKEAAITFRWKWQPGRHSVRFTADPLFKVRDLSLHNNSREDATDAWSLIWLVDRQVYDSFNRHRNFLGTASFEDWAQWHVDRMNRLFDESPGPPAAIQPRIRCDRVVVVDDAGKGWAPVLGAGVEPLDAGYDGAWAFGRRDDNACREWAANADWGLIHEWGHQLGLTDEYALDRPAFQNEVADEHGDPLLIGHRCTLQGSMMHGHGPTLFSPLCMAALRAQVGRRRGYYGDYYFCTPRRTTLRVLGADGRPVAGAALAFWQDHENAYRGQPAFKGVTNARGEFVLPNRPAPRVTTEAGFTQRDNPFGQVNVVGPGDVFCIRIQARNHTEYVWLEIAELNMAWFAGQKEHAVITRATRIPPLGAPPAPRAVTARVFRDSVRLSWPPVAGAAGYRVYRAAGEEFRYELVGGLLSAPEFTGTLDRSGMHRYAVTCVDRRGVESAFTPPAGAMHLLKPWGLAVTRDGRRYIRDAAYGQAVLQKPSGSAVGLVGSVHYHFEGSYDLALDPAGRLLSAKWGDGYNPKQGFKVQNPDLTLAFEHLEPEGDLPGQVRKPMGIAADAQGRIYVADTGNNRVQEFAPDGRFLNAIGTGELRVPMKPAFDSLGRLYVADSGNNRVAVYERDAGGWRMKQSLGGVKEPVSVIVDSRGRVFVSCNREAGVAMFDPVEKGGKLAWKYTGEPGRPLSGPRGLGFAPGGALLVMDEATQRVWTIHPPP